MNRRISLALAAVVILSLAGCLFPEPSDLDSFPPPPDLHACQVRTTM